MWKPANRIKAPCKERHLWAALPPALPALSLNDRVSWHIWINPSLCGSTIQSQNNLREHSWAPRSTLLAAPCDHILPWNLSPVMTKFSYSEYLSQFRNAGGKCNNVVSRLRGDRRRGDAQSDITSEPEWVFCLVWHRDCVCLRVCVCVRVCGLCVWELRSSVSL